MPGGRLEAAVKSLKPLAPESERIKFLQEAAIMGQFLHPNVVKLHGVVTVGEPVSDALGRAFGSGGVSGLAGSDSDTDEGKWLAHVVLLLCPLCS